MNVQSQVNGMVYIGVETTTGFNNPAVGVKQGYVFGWAGALETIVAFRQVLEEVVTIAAAASSTSANTSLLPTNSLILAVLGRVNVAIPTATTFTVGDATQAARFASGVAVAATTQFVGTLHQDPTVAAGSLGPRQTANAGVKITPSATPGTAAGRVRIQVFAETYVPPSA